MSTDNRPTWSFEQMQQLADKSIQTRMSQLETLISEVSEVIALDKATSIADKMDIVEQVVHSCGGEKRALFTEVSLSMIKLSTRVPMSNPIHPGDNSPIFCRKVTELLLMTTWVSAVRWYPSEDRGSVLIVSLKQ